MPQPTKGPRLGGGPAHERLLLANLATALFTHERIETTETKAKRLRPLADRLVTFAKRGDLHARRRVMRVIRDKSAVHRLFTEIAPQVADREGGYTRVIKTGFRKGDNAPMAVIELVLEPVQKKPSVKKAAAAADAAKAPKKDATPAVVDDTTVDGVEDIVAEEVTESVDVSIEETAIEDIAVEDTAAEAPVEETAPEDGASEDSVAAEGTAESDETK